MAAFGAELRRIRSRLGLTQAELAQRAGLSVEAVSLLERGRRAPRASTLKLIATGLRLADVERDVLVQAATGRVGAPWPLPTFPGRLVGREAALDSLSELLVSDRVRILTVTGPGGVGKTRLAVAAARRFASQLRDGVRWIPVSSISDAEGWLPSVSAAIGADGNGAPTVGAIIEYLARRELLLVMDNVEHRLDLCRALCARVVGRAPSVQLLITSRVRLQVPGELVYSLPPLTVPQYQVGEAVRIDDLYDAPASVLFLESAARQADLTLTTDDVRAVTRICQRVDGLPLAIELAAARTDVLGLPDLADTLDQSLELLPAAPPSSPSGEEQPERLLEAVVGWSYRALRPRDQVLFAALSAFSDGFSQDAACQVCALNVPQIEFLDSLSALVATSLVLREPDVAGQARFRLLRLISDFAADRLSAAAEADEVRQRHARYYADLAAQAAGQLTRSAGPFWLQLLDREAANMTQAVTWSLEHEPATALRIAGSLWRWCYLRGRYAEGRSWAARALAAGQDAAANDRAGALVAAGTLAFLQCDYQDAHRYVEECRRLYGELGDWRGLTWSLGRLGGIARERGDYPAALSWHRQALEVARTLNDPREVGGQLNYLSFVSWLVGDLTSAEQLAHEAEPMLTAAQDTEGEIWVLINRGVTARLRGDLDRADRLLTRAFERSDELLFPEGIAWALNQRGVVARLRENHAQALALQRASLTHHRQLGDRWRMASVLEELALLSIQCGSFDTATDQLREAERLRRQIGAGIPLVEREVYEAVLAALDRQR